MGVLVGLQLRGNKPQTQTVCGRPQSESLALALSVAPTARFLQKPTAVCLWPETATSRLL